MNVNEVPQDKLAFKGRDAVKKILYATDSNGCYTVAQSEGWEAETSATQQAWSVIEEKLAQVLQQVKNGELSPIAYFMHKQLMEVAVLAKYVGKWQWQVKRHLRQAVFARLNDKTLQKYADAFQIQLDTLKHFNPSEL